jgi:rhodanese-related sulfurtransferase
MTINECGFTALKPIEAKRLLDEGRALLIDIRDPNEFAREHIIGAHLVPLASLETHDFDRDRAAGKVAIFQCQSGRRTAMNGAKLLATGFKETYVIEGGLNAWRTAGLPSHLDRSQPIEIQRQVQITAGSLVLLGVILGALVSPWFFGLSAFVGGGLVFAGVSGSCAMAQLLAFMPWNRPRVAAA